MRRYALITISLLVAACSAPTELSEPIDRVIDAPREAVFDELDSPSNYPAFALVSDTGSTKRYELKMTDDARNAFSRADAGDIFEKYKDGTMIIVLQPNSLISVKLLDAGGGNRLQYNIRLADDETGSKTRVTSEIDESDGPLVGERKDNMNYLMAMTTDMVGRVSIDAIDRRL